MSPLHKLSHDLTMSIIKYGRGTKWMTEMIGKTLMKFERLPVETIKVEVRNAVAVGKLENIFQRFSFFTYIFLRVTLEDFKT